MQFHLDIQSKAGIASGAGAGFFKALSISDKALGVITWSGVFETSVYAAIGAAVGVLTTWMIRRIVKFFKSKF